ncbi:hypothetical protein Ahia01_001156300, partial [Argonauta hians]
MPFTMHSDYFQKIPLQALNILDLTLSSEAIVNQLIHAALETDRTELELNRRKNENEVLHNRLEMFNEFMLFREKTINLEGPLIEDKNILGELLACNSKIEKTREMIHERSGCEEAARLWE